MTRPFPWKCRNCGKQAVSPVVVDYHSELEHDGRAYSIMVPQLTLLECADCHNRNIPDESLEKVLQELRHQAGLLLPEEIRERRKNLGLTQEQLASHLRVAKETVCRWETGGQIQQRSMDLLLRMFFEVPEVRKRLEGSIPEETKPSLPVPAVH